MIKRFITDPSWWLLLIVNVYTIHYYSQNPGGFKTVVWLYWCQSVLIGIFNFFLLLGIKNNSSSVILKSSEANNTIAGTTKTAFLFLLHYGAFHVGYIVFLLAEIRDGVLDYRFLLLGLSIFFVQIIIDFTRKKLRQKNTPINIGRVFFLPYLRIIPMHLMFLIPAFTGWQISYTFLVLKTIADLFMYMVTISIDQDKKIFSP